MVNLKVSRPLREGACRRLNVSGRTDSVLAIGVGDAPSHPLGAFVWLSQRIKGQVVPYIAPCQREPRARLKGAVRTTRRDEGRPGVLPPRLLTCLLRGTPHHLDKTVESGRGTDGGTWSSQNTNRHGLHATHLNTVNDKHADPFFGRLADEEPRSVHGPV